MTEIWLASLYAMLAGAAIPLGAIIAMVERIQSRWLEQEFRHSVIAFGGGVLLAAIALVLVPKGLGSLNVASALLAFGAGGVCFFLADRFIEARGGAASQLMAMLLDFVPEAMAMGAMFATERGVGLLLAILIAFQNLPEGFNAFREIKAVGRIKPATVVLCFCLLAFLGPIATLVGFIYLSDQAEALGAIMLFAAGGILYLTFQDIAPQARLERHWRPPLGAVAGFMLGLLGHALVSQ